jgi:hypothetical protein
MRALRIGFARTSTRFGRSEATLKMRTIKMQKSGQRLAARFVMPLGYVRDPRPEKRGSETLETAREISCPRFVCLRAQKGKVSPYLVEKRAVRTERARAPNRPVAEFALPGRAVARIGLRMMPTFPPLPLKSRTAGFPQYGFKADISDGAFPSTTSSSRRAVCSRPSCTSLPVTPNPRSESRGAVRE